MAADLQFIQILYIIRGAGQSPSDVVHIKIDTVLSIRLWIFTQMITFHLPLDFADRITKLHLARGTYFHILACLGQIDFRNNDINIWYPRGVDHIPPIDLIIVVCVRDQSLADYNERRKASYRQNALAIANLGSDILQIRTLKAFRTIIDIIFIRCVLRDICKDTYESPLQKYPW